MQQVLMHPEQYLYVYVETVDRFHHFQKHYYYMYPLREATNNSKRKFF